MSIIHGKSLLVGFLLKLVSYLDTLGMFYLNKSWSATRCLKKVFCYT